MTGIPDDWPDENARWIGPSGFDCPAGNHPDGRHAWFPVMLLPWPFGMFLPSVDRCLFCGERDWWGRKKKAER